MNDEDPDLHRSERVIVTIRPGLDLTQTCLRVGSRHYELGRLSELQVQQSSHAPLTRQAALLALAALIMLVALARYMHPAGIVAATLVFLGLVVLALISSRSRPRRMELWAHYRGRPAQLFVSDDWWLFTALERQLRRSLTETRLGHVSLPPPATPVPAVPHPSMLHPSKVHPAL